MIATSFDESNVVLDKPPQLSYEQCSAVSAYAGQSDGGLPVVITCWKLTKEEFELIQKTGRVWLTLFGGGMQPACLSVESPFVPEKPQKPMPPAPPVL